MPFVPDRDMHTIRVLIVGNGSREHAIAWKLSQSARVESIIVVPGNGGTENCEKTQNIATIRPDDYEALVVLAQERNINLVVPGPEAPLVDGIEGYFRAVGISCYGPSKEAARMEGSKTFSKDFMKRHNIPTAKYENFSNFDEAKQYLQTVKHNVVIKASGLAGGKGVIIPNSKSEAYTALENIMLHEKFGSAGKEVVIEEFLEGEELSILTFSDGYTFRSLPPAQDHKRIFDGDQGPNTGGMGCYAPTKVATPELIKEVETKILEPTISGMRNEHFPFRGTLFTGLIITKDGPKVLEYNVRFGDPETPTLLPLLSKETDLAEIMLACTEGWLSSVNLKIDPLFSATVVIAAGGYPGSYSKGTTMNIQAPTTNVNLFHAGTTLSDGRLQTSGGRVIAAQATSDTIEKAVKTAYFGVENIKFDGMFYRKDIAHRALIPSASHPKKEALTYKSAGVNIDAGNEFVERIRKAVASTARPGADAEIGGFGGELNLDQAGYKGAPILVGAIDGVGTKLMIAQAMRNHNSVGIDLVAMNVNDLIVQGAEPLMFLDYYGCSVLNQESAAAFVEGVAAGCRIAKCALVGGETAEMPNMYKSDEYDVAGAAIGVIQPGLRLPLKNEMKTDDILIGLASAGIHSNGYSLVRRIVDREFLSYDKDLAPWDNSKLIGDSLLTPTRIYVDSILKVTSKNLIKGLSHITGGGLIENIPRMLPSHLSARIDVTSWTQPPVFKWLQKSGGISSMEMARTFNNGIGMVAVVCPANLDRTVSILKAAGEIVYEIGTLISRNEKDACVLENLSSWD
ncbi:Bifunctional purine biosynthetic protein ADE1 [Erysiphe neolycopersici]|uniref:Bifunctional purine biosynthetic protein ADE1 n=1 Tax=Erysiphe neolycopersici TaxID=212602 RepID=A0A420HNS4_9PEZI|nr:Bifunctional purine biosynthetic protein ADE1 [Erysiphe neolycopersici]